MSTARDRVVVPLGQRRAGGAHGGGPGAGGGAGGGKRDDEDWRDLLTRTAKGRVEANAHNLMMIIDHDESLVGMFALDEFANRVDLRRSAPWSSRPDDQFTEVDGVELSAWLGHPTRYDVHYRTSVVLECVEAVARRHRFHPVRDYLRGLKWDGVPRMRALFPKYCGTDDNEYHQRVGEMFVLSAAARILKPGCKVDTMLVLEGDQGIGKTRVTQFLFGGDRWYSDALNSPAVKDFYQDIVGKWGVEIGEMTAFSKAETSKIKQTLSATSDTYRPSYGRYSQTFPRQCVFVGTTNETEWQRDHTGGRRYLPVRCQFVDVDGIVAARDQLWGEAVAQLDAGVTDWWSLPPDARDQQDERFVEDAWAFPLLMYVSGHAKPEAYTVEAHHELAAGRGLIEVSVFDLMTRALHIDTGRITRADQMRVAAVLTHWHWKSFRPMRLGRQGRMWSAPDDWTPIPKPWRAALDV